MIKRFSQGIFRSHAVRKSVNIAVLVALSLFVSACSETPSGSLTDDKNGGMRADFSPPAILNQIRAVNENALLLSVEVNGVEYMFQPSTDGNDQRTSTITVNRGDQLRIVVTWSENYEGEVLPLAQASEDYTVPVNPDTELVLHFVDSDYYTRFDYDSDG